MAFGERMNRPANPQCVVSARSDDGPYATAAPVIRSVHNRWRGRCGNKTAYKRRRN